MSRRHPTAWDNFVWDVEEWVSDHMGWIVAALLGGFLFIGHAADAHAEDVVPEYENSNLLIKVNWFETTKELQEALTARGEEDFSDTAAYSECEVFHEEGDDIGFCEIWVVRPGIVDNYHTTSLGHEVLHGLVGDYHAP